MSAPSPTFNLHKDQTMKFSVPDMRCSHCVAAITKAVKAMDTTAVVSCDLENRTVTIDYPSSPDLLKASILTAGYKSDLIETV
ncbi:MAG: heavy-metal-associated domain-containing protein [Roseibium sp.]